MRGLAAIVVLFAAAVPVLADVDLDSLRASVVQVEVVLQGENYVEPWKRPNPKGTGGSGFFIGERRLMTNAHVVSDGKIIRVKRPDRPEKIDARVLFVAHDCDLAMLTVDQEDFFDGMVPMQIGDVPELRSTVTAVGYPVGGSKISITEGVVSRIELHDYVHSGADRHLTIQVDAAINPGNSGGPVVQGDKVVGVAFQTQFFSQNIGYMIPTPVIRHFLKDIEDGKYDGYPMLGVVTETLENDGLREYLFIPEGETGVVIVKALPNSSAEGLVMKNDVLHAVDAYKVENDGTVKVGEEYLELAFVVQEKYVGDTVTLKIRRGGVPMDVPVSLKKWDVKMSLATEYEKRPEYLIVGGYVFVPLTSNYAAVAGWRSNLRFVLGEYYRTLQETHPGQDQLVILSRVLRHDSTRYREYSDAIVKAVNGTPPKDFGHFVKLIDCAEKAVVTFEGVNEEPLILGRARIAEVKQAILDTYGIPADRQIREEE